MSGLKKPMLNILSILLISASCLSASASIQKFDDRFELVRKDGKLIAVRDKSISPKFKISTYINFIKDSIVKEQALMKSEAGFYRDSLNELFIDGENTKGLGDYNKGLKEDHEYVIDAIGGLEGVDFKEVFKNKKFQEVMNKYEQKLSEIVFYIDPMLVAKPDNSSFFYKLNLTHQAVRFALNLAKKQLSTIPVLNTAVYVITEVEKMIRTRRMYHQNMLLAYLENYSASDLGMTKEEADQLFSSIYESRIEWYMFWESTLAKNTWSKYGTDKFYANWRLGTNRYRNYRGIYNNTGNRLNYAFSEVDYKGERVIINLVDQQNQFDSKPAIAFNYDQPQKIKRLRTVLTLARLGISFVSFPAFLKDLVTDYIKSYYEKQQITEGALLAQFEMLDQEDDILVLKKQYLNAFR